MAYNTKAIKTDVNAKPIPQYYNPLVDEYEVLQGRNGAARQVLYGSDGQPVSIVDNKLAVKAAELETKIEAVRVLLNALTGEDFATQTTLAQILEKMIAAPATEAKQDVIAGHVDGVETLLTALKEKDFATETKLEAVRVLLNSLAGEDFATSAKQAEMLAALGSQSTAAKQDALAALVGAIDAAAVSDPAAAGAVIALLKGLLSRLQTLEGKIDGITDGTAPATTQLKGSLIADEEAVPVKRVGREYASNTSSPVDNQEVPAGGFVNYRVDLKGYGHVVSSVVTSESAPNTNGNYKVVNELGNLWGTSVSKDYTARNFTSEPLQILGDTVAFRYQNNGEAPVVLLRLRYYAF